MDKFHLRLSGYEAENNQNKSGYPPILATKIVLGQSAKQASYFEENNTFDTYLMKLDPRIYKGHSINKVEIL